MLNRIPIERLQLDWLILAEYLIPVSPHLGLVSRATLTALAVLLILHLWT